jgi:cellulose synthase/poly-beta-1,6-N-acetylglucosamine synthase-like glycosyltransferase
MSLFYFFAGLLVLQGLVSALGGRRWRSFVRREMARTPSDYTPYASVIVPCRGLDQGLAENLRTLFRQDYPRYEIIFVSDSADDPALAVVSELRARLQDKHNSLTNTRIVVAGQATGRGQKVHNLCAGVAACDETSEVFVFVDTDARPHVTWLRALVAPLADESLGAATGYRWFVPVQGGFAAHLRAVWNASIASALGQDTQHNFCWGGSTAIRRTTFDAADVLTHWRGALSDDFALTRALQQARQPIRFVPACLVASHEDCRLRELCEFTTRQMKLTRVYAPHLWRIVLISNLLFTIVFFGGLLLVALRAWRGQTLMWPLALLVLIFLLGVRKAYLRLRAVALTGLPINTSTWLAHTTLWPLAAVLYTYNATAAGLSRRLTWRGISYELKSPTETIVRGRPQS